MRDGRAGRVIVPGAAMWKAERQAWRDMRQRCLTTSHKQYKDYGGRGITICDSWRVFQNFYNDMGPRPTGYTLERHDNDKGYGPTNCCWATRVVQANNRRGNLLVEIDGVSLSMRDWARQMGLNFRSVESRRRRGCTPLEALTKPWEISPCRRPKAT